MKRPGSTRSPGVRRGHLDQHLADAAGHVGAAGAQRLAPPRGAGTRTNDAGFSSRVRNRS